MWIKEVPFPLLRDAGWGSGGINSEWRDLGNTLQDKGEGRDATCDGTSGRQGGKRQEPRTGNQDT